MPEHKEAVEVSAPDAIESTLTTPEIDVLRERLRTEIERRERAQSELDLLRTVLDGQTTHFLVTDRDGKVVYLNKAISNYYGIEAQSALGVKSRRLFAPFIADDVLERMNQGAREERNVREEFLSKRQDGSASWIGLTTQPLRDESGKIKYFVTLGADITQRREDERKRRDLQEQLVAEMRERERMAIELRLAQKLESVGRLAAGIAHEINTPIQYVGDSVHFLRGAFDDVLTLLATYRTLCGDNAAAKAAEEAADTEFLTAEVPNAFGRTLEGVERVAAIVRAMKEFAHPDGTGQSSADINHALETTLTIARSEYKYLASVETHFNELPLVVCNIGELNQVFVNLIVNAAHAIQDSGKDSEAGRITISTAVEGDAVAITIADNGCGIDAAHLEKIFDPFFTTKEVGRGTGQGLAIARSIVVDKHGGEILVHSDVGAGTRFTVRLPTAGKVTESEQ